MTPTHLIVGCGYLGRRVAALWLAQGKRVAALTRSKTDELRSLGVEPILGDVLQPESLELLPQVQTVLYAVGMDRSAGRSFREVYLEGLRHVLERLPAPRCFLYVSSTSVYGQVDGEAIDESAITEPLEENGKTILEAETALRAFLPGSIILRFAGIYGRDRVIRRAAVERGEALIGDADKWLNLIHVEDGARAVIAAEERGKAGETYLIADDEPMRRRDFYTLLAQLLRAPAAQFQAGSAAMREANRRILNRKMRQELGVELAYPNYRKGLRASVS